MNSKKKTLLVGTLFLAIALLLSVFAFLASTGSFSVGSYHTGSAGETGSTTSFTFRSTTTYQQPGDGEMTTSSYSMNLGWLGLGTLQISSTTISPYAVINGSNVTLSISANNAESVWATITKPDSSQENLTLTNNANTNFTNTTLLNRYNVTFYANDSSGEIVSSILDYFETFEPITFNFTVIDFTGTGVNSSWDLLYRDEVVASSSSPTGNHSITIPNTPADLRFKDSTQRLQVILRNINVTIENNKQFGVEKHPQASGYLTTYAVNNTDNYAFTNSTIRIYYDDLIGSITNEANLQLHKCDNYDFAERSCSGSWTDVTSSATQDTGSDFFEYLTTTFSGFSIKQYVAPAGGGGRSVEVCVYDLNYDWACGEWSGCTDNVQIRVCKTRNNCGGVYGKPETEKDCEGIQLFDISLSLDDSFIQSSDKLSAVVTFESFGDVPTPVNLTFIILDVSGNEIHKVEDSITVTTEEVLRKNFRGLNLAEGRYTLVLQTLYNIDVFDEFKQDFEIGKEKRGITGAVIGWIGGSGKWYIIGIVVGVLIIILIWLLVRRTKRRKLYGYHREKSPSFKGKILEILRRGRVRG